MWVGLPSQGFGAACAAPHRRPNWVRCDERKKNRYCWRFVRLEHGSPIPTAHEGQRTQYKRSGLGLQTKHFCCLFLDKHNTSVYYSFHELETDEKVVGTTRRNLPASEGFALESIPERQAIRPSHARHNRAG